MPAASSPPGAWLSEAAPAKINLFLRVTGRRPDGYHELESLAVFAGAGDVVRAAPAATLTLALSGPMAAGLSAGPDNLVLRAARALADHARSPRALVDHARSPRALADQAGRQAGASLVLDKHLPVASGIGGGSADAAATLRVLARLWGIDEAPAALALALGADVPVCLSSAPAVMRGVGEALSPAPLLPAYGLALVNPGVPVATADVFRARQGGFSAPVELPGAWPDAGALARDLAVLGNDLQPPALAICPSIGDVLEALRRLPGCLLAQMSGSGATCFGIFATPALAATAFQLARPAQAGQPAWWAWGGAPLPLQAQGLPQPPAWP